MEIVVEVVAVAFQVSWGFGTLALNSLLDELEDRYGIVEGAEGVDLGGELVGKPTFSHRLGEAGADAEQAVVQ